MLSERAMGSLAIVADAWQLAAQEAVLDAPRLQRADAHDADGGDGSHHQRPYARAARRGCAKSLIHIAWLLD